MKKIKLTPEILAHCVYEKGLTYREIGDLYGISKQRANALFKAYEEKYPEMYQEYKEKGIIRKAEEAKYVKELIESGLSRRIIREKTGFTDSKIDRIVEEYNIEKPALTKEVIEEYVYLGLTDEEIGAIFGRTACGIRNRRLKYGIKRENFLRKRKVANA